MAREDDNDSPVTPEECRQFIRDMVLSGPGRRKVAKAIFNDPRMLATVLKIAVGDDEKTNTTYQFINSSTNQMIAALPDDVLDSFVRTGELSADTWLKPGEQQAVQAPAARSVPGNGNEPPSQEEPMSERIKALTKRYPPDPHEK